jgi:hypothetical protein
MRRWQPTVVLVGAVALFLTARPAQAQVWVGPAGPPGVVVRPAAPVWVAPPVQPVSTVWVCPPVRPAAPVWVSPAPAVVSPGWGTRAYWGGGPTWVAPRPVGRWW